jgi:hypothetical protein
MDESQNRWVPGGTNIRVQVKERDFVTTSHPITSLYLLAASDIEVGD